MQYYPVRDDYWQRVSREIRGRPARSKKRILKTYGVPTPASQGARSSTGLPTAFKLADWRWIYPDAASFHVEEFDDHYLIHWDEVDPDKDLVGHALRDTPELVLGGLLALIGLPFLIKALSR